MITANVSGAGAQTAGSQTSCFEGFDPEIHDSQILNQIDPAAQNNVIFIIMRVGAEFSTAEHHDIIE